MTTTVISGKGEGIGYEQVAKRITNIRLTKQKKTDTWQIVRMPVSCFIFWFFRNAL